jgi:hypothetical protein
VPVRAVLLLADGDAAIEPVAGRARLLAVLDAELLPDRAQALAGRPDRAGCFAIAAALADRVPVGRLSRPRYPWAVEDAAAAVVSGAAS